MPLCAGLVGPKSENVEISLVLPLLFEGSRGPWVRQDRERLSEPDGFDIEKVDFWLKMLRVDLGNCASCLSRKHIFVKNVKNMVGKRKMHPKNLRWRVWCLCVRAWWGRKVKILRFHRLRSGLSGPVNSKPTLLRRILLLQRGPRYDEKGNRRDKGAIGVKKGLQKRVYPTLFDVEKVRFLV